MTNLEIEALLPSYLVNSEILAVVVIDLQENYLYHNEIFRKNFIFEDEVLGKSCFYTIAPDDHQLCRETVKKCFQHPEKPFSLYLRKRTANRQSFYLTHWDFSVFIVK